MTAAIFSPDSTRVLTASKDKTARLWNATSGKQLIMLSGHAGGLTTGVFSSDGERLLTASYDKSARIWDTRFGRQLALPASHSDVVLSASFSADGTRVLTASGDNSARIWDADSGTQLAILTGHKDILTSASFSPDAKVWDLVGATTPPPDWFPKLLRVAGRREFASSGELIDIPGSDWHKLRASVSEAARNDPSRYGEIARQYLGISIDGSIHAPSRN